MAETGSLIKIHSHTNFDVLNLLSESDGNLYYKNKPIFTKISNQNNNAVTQKNDGIFVDSTYFLTERQYTILSKFNFVNGTLVYGNKIVSCEYETNELDLVNEQVWSSLNEEYPFENIEGVITSSDGKTIVTADNKILTGGTL